MPTLLPKAFGMLYVVWTQQNVFIIDLSTPSIRKQSMGSPTYCFVVIMMQKAIKMITVSE